MRDHESVFELLLPVPPTTITWDCCSDARDGDQLVYGTLAVARFCPRHIDSGLRDAWLRKGFEALLAWEDPDALEKG